jgi:AcrR family transcriptional regulator
VGLRELKKEQTRRLIAETAWRLFAERGFDRVSVAEIAREAQVAEATVFNYFPSKEDLFYSRLEAFGTQLAEAVSARPAGEPALAAFGRALLALGGLLERAQAGDGDAAGRLRMVQKMIADSPALLTREQQAINANADALAAVLAAEAGAPDGDLIPQMVANVLIGVHRALVGHVRRQILAGADPARLAADVRAQATSALALLAQGLGDYAPKPA